MSKPAGGPRKTVVFRLPEQIWAEVILLNPHMVSPMGTVAHGAVQNYLLSLIMQDNERKRSSLQETVDANT